MTKDQLVGENANLKREVSQWEDNDSSRRRNISRFLGSVTTSYSTETVKVLSWPEIYFELGKITQAKDQFQEVETIRRDIERVGKKFKELHDYVIEDISPKVFPQQEPMIEGDCPSRPRR